MPPTAPAPAVTTDDAPADADHTETLSPEREALAAAFAERGELLESECGERIAKDEAHIKHLIENYRAGTTALGVGTFLVHAAQAVHRLDTHRRRQAELGRLAGRKPRAVPPLDLPAALREMAQQAGIPDASVEATAGQMLVWLRDRAGKVDANIRAKLARIGRTDEPMADAGDALLAELAELYQARAAWAALIEAVEADPYMIVHAIEAQQAVNAAGNARARAAGALPPYQATPRPQARDLRDPAVKAALEAGKPVTISHQKWSHDYKYHHDNYGLVTQGMAKGLVKFGD